VNLYPNPTAPSDSAGRETGSGKTSPALRLVIYIETGSGKTSPALRLVIYIETGSGKTSPALRLVAPRRRPASAAAAACNTIH
jgi:hypothetical protein